MFALSLFLVYMVRESRVECMVSREGVARERATARVKVRGFGVGTCGGGYLRRYKGGVCVCTVNRIRCVCFLGCQRMCDGINRG